MRLVDIENYVQERYSEGLTKIETTLELDPDTIGGNYNVTKTKETYVYANEDEADSKINEVRKLPGFAGCDKKFKEGKMNKAGEIVKPDTYTVVIKLNH